MEETELENMSVRYEAWGLGRLYMCVKTDFRLKKQVLQPLKKEKYLQGSDLENVSRSNRFLGKQEREKKSIKD